MKLEQVILRSTRASQPAASAVPTGTICYVTDELVTERSNGTAWEDISDGGGSGSAGPPGPQGDPGTPGEVWFSGSGVPAGALSGSIVGDWYLNTATGDVYEKTGTTTWTLRANIKGPTGTTGSTGSPGAPGENWFSGSGVPAGSLSGSVVGDWYFDTVTGNVYEKTGTTTWTLRANIMGPQGPPAAPIAHHASHEPGGADALQLTAEARLFGRGAGAGGGALQEISLGNNLALSGTILSANARVSNLINYTYSTAQTEPPGTDQVRFNSSPYGSITKLWPRFVSSDGQDVYWGLMVLAIGSTILVQDKNDHTAYVRFVTTGLPTDKGVYAEIPVAWVANGSSLLGGQPVLLQASGGTSAHHTTHEAGGSDPIKLDDLAAPDDTTDLNATTGAHGLLRKLDNDSAHFLNGQGAWATPAGGGGGATDLDYLGDYAAGTYNDGDIVIGSDGIAYLCVKAGVTTPPEPWPGTGIGVAGPPGANGEQWFSGSSIPASGLGNIGDWYLLTTNGSVYEKTDGTTWTLTANIKGPTGSTGITQPFQLGHTWGLVGDVTALTALPGIFIPMNGTQTAKLVSIRTKVTAGSVGVQVKRNSTNVGSVITVTTAATTTSLGSITLAANDEITLTLSSPSAIPTNLTATIIIEHTPA